MQRYNTLVTCNPNLDPTGPRLDGLDNLPCLSVLISHVDPDDEIDEEIKFYPVPTQDDPRFSIPSGGIPKPKRDDVGNVFSPSGL